jgi:pyroglutamyl-peptidase
MKRILLTSFEPFGNQLTNQSFEVANSIPHVNHIVLPVVFNKAHKKLLDHLKKHTYDLVIGLGEAPIARIHLEHYAMNMNHARISDNEGKQPKFEKIDPRGPEILNTSLPFEKLGSYLEKNNIPFSDSFHAGTYVCNDYFYRTIQAKINIPYGFIHVPSDPERMNDSKDAMQKVVDFFLNESR